MSAKRGPGRPLTPGNQPGADGCPQLRLRLEPEVMEQVKARGGSAWARAVILEALAGVDSLEDAERLAFQVYESADVEDGAAYGQAFLAWREAKAALDARESR